MRLAPTLYFSALLASTSSQIWRPAKILRGEPLYSPGTSSDHSSSPPPIPPILRRRLERLEPSPTLESLRAYVGFALEKANPAPGFDNLLDDELQLILGKVALAANSPKQVLALAAVCKRFKKLIRHPAVWRRLDMSPHAAFLTDRLLLGMMKDDSAFALLRRVDLGGCTRVTDKAVCELLNVCGVPWKRSFSAGAR